MKESKILEKCEHEPQILEDNGWYRCFCDVCKIKTCFIDTKEGARRQWDNDSLYKMSYN